MTIIIDGSMFESLPAWVWAVVGVCGWYPLAGLFLRVKADNPIVKRYVSGWNTMAWLCSPIAALVFVIGTLAWVVIGVVSCGYAGQPPWKWGE